jgi:hypothetical protein
MLIKFKSRLVQKLEILFGIRCKIKRHGVQCVKSKHHEGRHQFIGKYDSKFPYY